MDAVGNVYRRADGQDRRYGRGGLLEAANDERGAVTFTHDADGNQTTKHEPDGTHWTYRWNGHGFLSEVERRSDVADAARASRVEPDLRVRFTYDAFARRVAKRTEADGDVRETRFVWDGHTVLHELRSVLPDEATRDSLGLRRASLDPPALAPATLQAHDEPELITWYWDPGTFTPVVKERAGRRWSIASDHLGTPSEMYDELGELAWRMQLDVFGVPTFEEGTAEDCPWRWPGQYDDVETGQFYNRWRYYDAETGRYTSLDPIRLFGGQALYSYVRNTTSALDPLGLNQVCDVARAQAAVDQLRSDRPELFQVFKCIEAAAAIRRVLQAAGIRGTLVRLESAGRIIGHRVHGRISETGIHEFVDVGGHIFDNLTPHAVPREQFLGDLLATGSPNRFVTTPF
jgi:RHS repeat-associated protein